ncbi:GTPase HflX [bacterium]|nr:GTPase HflX [bacterium]
MLTLEQKKERAILVGIGVEYRQNDDQHRNEPLEELRLLADTAGALVIETMIQPRQEIDATYYMGKGKAQELLEEVNRLEATCVIFDNDLAPAQVANLQKLLDIKVIDRSGLILDIFAFRARTREAKIQVELAQLKYMLPRLTRQWTHLSRQVGGIGTRGPGETQLEVDRRRVRDRIAHLAQVLATIEKRRELTRKKRESCFRISLVGYTNAGKSTLLNALSGAGVPVENKLFKTLDSVTRLVRYKATPDMLISDTVGFIRNLPHDLVASFQSTLAEVRDADLLLHVIDITNPEWEEQVEVVMKVLADLGVSETNTIPVFNKIDMLENETLLTGIRARYPTAVCVSSVTLSGIDDLKEAMRASVLRNNLMLTMEFGPGDGPLLSAVYRHATVLETKEAGDRISLTFTIPASLAKKYGIVSKEQRTT